MTDQLTPLLHSLESATGPSRELDALIDCALESPGWRKDPRYLGMVASPNGQTRHYAYRYTASLDVALELVSRCLPGWSWDLGCDDNHLGRYHYATIWSPTYDGGDEVRAASAALALLSALLRALIAEAASPIGGRVPQEAPKHPTDGSGE